MQVIVGNGGKVVNLNYPPDWFGLANSLFRMKMTENVKFCKQLFILNNVFQPNTVQMRLNKVYGIRIALKTATHFPSSPDA